VAANTLIGVKREEGGLADPDIDKLQNRLLVIRHKHFSARNATEKTNLRKEDAKRSKELSELLKKDGFYNSTDAAQMASWNPYDQNASSPFFDPYWMFGVKDGFDVVIGNPPYVSIRTKQFDVFMKKYYKDNFKLATGQYDLFVLFIEVVEKILNKNGILAFITPKGLLSNENFEEVRIFLNDNLPIIQYLDAGMPFESASVEANVFISTRRKPQYVKVDLYNKNLIAEKSKFNYQQFNAMPFHIFPFSINENICMVLNSIAKKAKIRLADCFDITRGLECGFNHTSISKRKSKYRIIKGEHITRYAILETEWYVIPDDTDRKVFKSKNIFTNVPKLVTKFVSNNLEFALDNLGYYNTNVVYNIHPIADNKKYINFILALCNGKMMNFWFFNTYSNNDKLFPHIQKNQLDSIPVVLPSNTNTFDKIVDKILAAKAANPKADTTALERWIDNLVYRLYNLTWEEVKVVEPGFPLGKAEYEGMGG
jgi:hypothetical protein